MNLFSSNIKMTPAIIRALAAVGHAALVATFTSKWSAL